MMIIYRPAGAFFSKRLICGDYNNEKGIIPGSPHPFGGR